MAVVSGQTKWFTAASPVTRYWLANCVGFTVAGGGSGTVERVLADGDPHVAAQLEIRHGRRLRRLPVTAVVEVIPADQVLVMRGASRAPAQRAALRHGAGAFAGQAVAVLGHAAVAVSRVAVALGGLLLGLATWLVRCLVRRGKEGVRLVRSLPWQQYGRSVRSVTTKLWLDLSTRLSLLLTTSSGRSSAKSSSEQARTTSST